MTSTETTIPAQPSKSWSRIVPPAIVATVASLVVLGLTPAAPFLLRLFPPNSDTAPWYWPTILYAMPAIWLVSLIVAVRSSGRKGWLLLLLAPMVLIGWITLSLFVTACMILSCPS